MRTTRNSLIALAILVSMAACSGEDPLPSCEEDAMLIGAGDYDLVEGRWDSYECGPSRFDLVTFNEVQELKAQVERIADCPELMRGPSDHVAVFFDGISTYGELANGDRINLKEIVFRCV